MAEAPIPSARVSMVTAAKPGFFLSCRMAKRKSSRTPCIHSPPCERFELALDFIRNDGASNGRLVRALLNTHFTSWHAIHLPELDTAALLRGDGHACCPGRRLPLPCPMLKPLCPSPDRVIDFVATIWIRRAAVFTSTFGAAQT